MKDLDKDINELTEIWTKLWVDAVAELKSVARCTFLICAVVVIVIMYNSVSCGAP